MSDWWVVGRGYDCDVDERLGAIILQNVIDLDKIVLFDEVHLVKVLVL